MPLRARILVTLLPQVHDPQGEAVAAALSQLGFPEVRGVRVGKLLELSIDGASSAQARDRVEEMCRRLLANPVIEQFQVELLDENDLHSQTTGAR